MSRMIKRRSVASPVVTPRLTAAAATLTALLAVAGCERWALDRQMEELCKNDGGLKVYETVTLSASYFDVAGRVKLGSPTLHQINKTTNRMTQSIGNDEFRIVRDMVTLKDGDPLKGEGVLGRTEQTVTRVADQKVLAIAVSYSRSGGDFIVIDHWSAATCPNPNPQPLVAVFVKES